MPTFSKDLLWRCLNVVMLGIGFLIAFSGLFVNISMTTVLTGQLVGKVISTVPVGVHMASGAVSLGIAYFLIPLVGLRVVYITAGLLGAVGSALMIIGADQRIFGLLIVGTILQGPSIGAAQTFRFTSAAFFPAPEFSQAWRTRAISFTVGCAFFATGIGPEATRVVNDDLDTPFTGAYVLLMGLYCALTLLTGLVDFKLLARIQANQGKQEQHTRHPAAEADGNLDKSSAPEGVRRAPQPLFEGLMNQGEGGASQQLVSHGASQQLVSHGASQQLVSQMTRPGTLHLGNGVNGARSASGAPGSLHAGPHCCHDQPCTASPLTLQLPRQHCVQQQQQQQQQQHLQQHHYHHHHHQQQQQQQQQCQEQHLQYHHHNHHEHQHHHQQQQQREHPARHSSCSAVKGLSLCAQHMQEDDPHMQHTQVDDPHMQDMQVDDPHMQDMQEVDPHMQDMQVDNPHMQDMQVDDPHMQDTQEVDPHMQHTQVDNPPDTAPDPDARQGHSPCALRCHQQWRMVRCHQQWRTMVSADRDVSLHGLPSAVEDCHQQWRTMVSADRDVSLRGRSDDALNVPPPFDDHGKGGSVSLCRGMCRPSFFMPALSGATAFFTMSAIMTSTPVAMKKAGHTPDDATFTIEAHIGTMYLPAFVVGDLVALVRFLVCQLLSSRQTLVRLLGCLVFLIPMPRLAFSHPLHCDDHCDDQNQEPQSLSTTDGHPSPEHQQQQQQQQQQQLSPEEVHPHTQHFQQGERHTVYGGLQEQIRTMGLKHSRSSSKSKSSSSSSRDTGEPHEAVLVSNIRDHHHHHHHQQQQQQQQQKGIPSAVRDTVPITSIMVLGSAILAASPGVLLAGESLDYFMGGLALAGVGWALNYVAASSLVTAAFAHDPVKLRTAQTLMDVAVLTLMAGGNATAGVIVRLWGWRQFLYLYLAIILALFLWNCLLHVCVVPSGICSRAERLKG